MTAGKWGESANRPNLGTVHGSVKKTTDVYRDLVEPELERRESALLLPREHSVDVVTLRTGHETGRSSSPGHASTTR